MKDNDNIIFLCIPVPKPGNTEKLDLSFLQETISRSEEDKAKPPTQEELEEYMRLLCPPSLREEEDI